MSQVGRVRRWLSILLAAVLAATVIGAGSMTADAAAKTASHHVGIAVGDQWVGSWNVWDGKRNLPGFCFDPHAGHPTSLGAVLVKGRIPGMTDAQSRDMKYVVQKYGNSTSPTTAAALTLAIWKTQNDPTFRTALNRLLHSSKLAGAVQRMNVILREAPNHGPYKRSGAISRGNFGSVVKGYFKVLNASSKPASGKLIRLSASGLSGVARQGVTNASGVLTFQGRVITVGTYRVNGTLVSPSSLAVVINKATAGHQRTLMFNGATETLPLSVSNHGVTSAAKLVQTCGNNCLGQAPLSTTKTNECGNLPERVFTVVNGRVVQSFDVAPCRTVTKVVTLHDNDHVVAQVCFLDHMGGVCKSSKIVVGTTTIICPPWPRAVVVVSCNCTTTASYVTFTAPASVRGYRARVSVNGVVATKVVPAGGSATVNIGAITHKVIIQNSFVAYTNSALTTPIGPAHNLGLPVTVG